MLDEVLLNITHHAHGEFGREDAGVLSLILLENIGLHRAADLAQCVGLDAGVGVGIHQLITADAQQREPRAIVPLRQFTPIDRDVLSGLHLGRAQRANTRFGAGPVNALAQMPLDTLVDNSVHEHRQNDRCRPVDGH